MSDISSAASEVMFRTSKHGSWEYHRISKRFPYASFISRDPNSSLYFFLASITFSFRSVDLDGSRITPNFLIFSGRFASLLEDVVVVTVVVDTVVVVHEAAMCEEDVIDEE